MEFLTVTELKNNMKVLIDHIAAGETVAITKNGKPVVRMEAFTATKQSESLEPSWKKPFKRIKLKANRSSTDILREMRDSARW